MACSTLTSGITFNSCAKSMGGIKGVYLANYDDVDLASITIDADGQITSIPLIPTDNTDPQNPIVHYKFYSFHMRKNTGSMTSTLNVDDNGSSVSTDVVMSWREMEYEKRKAMSAFLQGEFCAIVVDVNGRYWFLGKDLAATASAGTGETGTSNTDANRYEITINDVSNDWPHEIKVGTGGVNISSLLAPGEQPV